GRSWKIVRARYWHHTNGQHWAINNPDSQIPLEFAKADGEDHPVVWIQRNAHGSYLDRKTCSEDPEGDGDPCSEGFVALAAVGPNGNVGEADAHILGADHDASARTHMKVLGFAGESPWEERKNAFGVRGFCGGLPSTDYLGTVKQIDG